MACGEKYAYLIRTDTGLTEKKRCRAYCNETDYADWHTAAHGLQTKILKQWAILRKTELEREQGTALSDASKETIAAYEESTRNLPLPWWSMATHLPAPKVDQAVEVMWMGCCELEKIDEALTELGVEVPEVPGPKEGPRQPTILESIQTVAMLGLVGAAVYGIAKLVILSRKKMPLVAAEEGAE